MKKILLFLSPKRDHEENEYLCPNGVTVRGKETNDAPVRFLLREHPDVDEILCIVTKKAKEKETPEYFQQLVAEENSKAKCRFDLEFNEENDKSFEEDLLPRILAKVEPGDEILLETTGGFRITGQKRSGPSTAIKSPQKWRMLPASLACWILLAACRR